MSEPTSAQMYMPWVVETTHRGERQWDIFSRLLKDRIVFLGTEVNDDVANAIIAQMLFLESDDPDKEITLYINSPGGAITAGLAITTRCSTFDHPYRRCAWVRPHPWPRGFSPLARPDCVSVCPIAAS